MFRLKSVKNVVSKRVVTMLGSTTLVASGLVAGIASPASAASIDPLSIGVTRSFTNGSVVILPGESVEVNVNIQTVNAFKLVGNAGGAGDFASGDSLTVEPNEESAGLTRSSVRWSTQFGKYSGGYYQRVLNSLQANQPLLSMALNNTDVAAGAAIFSWSYRADFVNNTQNTITYSFADPVVKTTKSGAESVLNPSNYNVIKGGGASGSISVTKSGSSYTALSSDTAIKFSFEPRFGGVTACLSRDYAEESFNADYRLLADGTNVTSSLPAGVSLEYTRTYINDYSQNPATMLQPALKLTGYYIEDGYFYLVYSGRASGTIGDFTVGSVQNTGQFFDAGNSRSVDSAGGSWSLSAPNTLKQVIGFNPRSNVGSAASPEPLPSNATITSNPNDSLEIQSYLTPATKTSVAGSGSMAYQLSSPQTGVEFGGKFDLIATSDSSSATRTCGPVAPSSPTVDPSSSSMQVTISQVATATYYKCYAFLASNPNTSVADGQLQEDQRASASKCSINGLSPNTAYLVNVKAGSAEGLGAASANVSSSTTSGGGGGGGGGGTPGLPPRDVLINTNTSTASTIKVTFVAPTNTTGLSGYNCNAYVVTSESPLTLSPSPIGFSSPVASSATTCNVTSNSGGFITGQRLAVKVFAQYISSPSGSATSSNSFVVPPATWELSTPSNGGNFRGNVNAVTAPDLSADTRSTTSIRSDLRGDAYYLNRSVSSATPAVVTFTVKKIKSSTRSFDSSFGTSGTVSITADSDVSTTANTPSFIAAFGAGKWIFTTGATQDTTPGTRIFEGANAAATSIFKSGAELATWCNANQDPDQPIVATSGSISFISAPTSRPVASISCRPSVGASVTLLASYSATGELTLITQLTYSSTSSKPATQGSTQYSLNANASAPSDLAVAILVVYKNSSLTNQNTLIAERRLIRIKVDGSVTNTDNAYPRTTSNKVYDEPNFVLSASNDGTKIYGVRTEFTPGANMMDPPTTVNKLHTATTGAFGDVGLTIQMDAKPQISDTSDLMVSLIVGGVGFAPESGGAIQIRRGLVPYPGALSVGGTTSIYALARLDLSTGVLTTGEVMSAATSSSTFLSSNWYASNGNALMLLNTSTTPVTTKIHETTNVLTATAGTVTPPVVTPPVVTPPAKKTPRAATVATKVKVGKTFTIALHATKGTASKGANSDGLPAVVSVASSSKAFCSATKIIKSKKITGYTIKGLKAGKCSVVVTITGSSAFNALTKTTVVTVSK